MFSTWLAPSHWPSSIDVVGLAVIVIPLGNLIIRMILCSLAIFVTVKTLKCEGQSEFAAQLRADRLVVLAAVLTALRCSDRSRLHDVAHRVAVPRVKEKANQDPLESVETTTFPEC
jgi:hypothetical protein